MDIATFVRTISVVPSFSSRPFIAAFAASAFSYFFPSYLPTPDWFTTNVTISILALLALIEIFAQKNNDLRIWLHEIDGFIKVGVSFVTTFALVDTESAAVLMTLTGSPDSMLWLSSIFTTIWSVINSFMTWFVSTLRYEVMVHFIDLDEDDETGLGDVVSWLEDFFAFGWMAFAIVLPIVALGLFAITVVILYVVQYYFDQQNERRKRPCVECGTPLYLSALKCHQCEQPSEKVHMVGFFGQSTGQITTNLVAHRWALLRKRRCPQCAAKLTEKSVRQMCSTDGCGVQTFASPSEARGYLRVIEKKVIPTAFICLLFSMIPIIGLVPGLIYYRLSLISDMRRYIPRHVGCVARWGVRLLNITLITLQPIPILGMFTLPAMCISNYYIYRQTVVTEVRRAFNLGLTNKSVQKPAQKPALSDDFSASDEIDYW